MRRAALGVCLLLLSAGCAGPVDDSMPYAESFDEASLTYQVPRSILVGIATVESGMVMRSENDKMPCFGLMGLCEQGSLEVAAKLLRLPPEVLVQDPHWNVMGAAALLDHYRSLNEKKGWEDLLQRFGGRGDPEAGAIFAREVMPFAAAELGYTLPEEKARPDSSRARWVPAIHYTRASRGSSQIRKIVIHTTQGSYSGAISWFRNPTSRVSAHYVIRSRDGQITQMVEEKDIAWHVRCWNSQTIGIEHEGFVDAPGTWYTDAMYRSSAALVREIAARYGIPLDRDHILGHGDVSRLSGYCTTHTDPGSGWNWTKFMALVRGSTPPPTAPPPTSQGNLRGVIFDAAGSISDPRNRISGVSVRLSTGATVTTGSTGSYLFRVNPGRYTVIASKSGYRTASTSRSVTSGNDTWGSLGLRRSASRGTLRGVIYDAARASSDSANRLSGVSVRLSNGLSATTGSDGAFSFQVPPGDYTVSASRSGFQTGQVTRTVAAGATIWGSVGLRRIGYGTLQGVIYNVSRPASDQHNRLSGATVRLSNGMQVRTGTDGAFSFRVLPGTYTVTVTRSGFRNGSVRRAVGAGAIVWGSVGLRAVPQGRLLGVVYDAARPLSDGRNRLSGATVRLSNGSSTVTGADGLFVFQIPAGTYTATVTRSGWSSGSVRRTVQVGRDVWGSVGLHR